MRRISIQLLVAFSLLSLPTIAMADGTIRVTDTVAGLGTSIEIQGSVPSTTIDVHLVSASGEDTVLPTQTDTRGSANAPIPERLTAEAGTYRVFAILGMRKITNDATFEVLHDRMDPAQSTITVSDSTLLADGRSSVTVTVTLRDAQRNPLAGRPVQLVGSRTQDTITPLADSRETDRAGRMQFGIQTDMGGAITFRAMDLLSGTMLDSVANVTAQGNRSVGGFETNTLRAQVGGSDVLDHFEVIVSTPEAKVKDVIPLVTIEATDANGNIVESFTGTVRITTPSDPSSTLPGLFSDHGEVTFTGKNRGVVTIPWAVSFSRSGDHEIDVSDASNQIHGKTVVHVSGGDIPDNRRIRLESPQDGDAVNTLEIFVKGRDKNLALRNLHVFAADGATLPEALTSGPVSAIGDADDSGAFAFTVKLPDSKDIVLQVQDDTGQYDSGIIHLTLDTKGPSLQYSFDPEKPEEGHVATLTVKSEPGLPEVSFTIKQQTITLTESDPGTYTVLFLAPSSGDSSFRLSGRDPAGNISDVNGTLGVSGPDLPQVQNVTAEPRARGILLAWDMVPDSSLTAYRIEAGTSPGRVDVTLDAPTTEGSAAVMGLKSGTDYFVTVSAVRGDDVGPKSNVVLARTLGMELQVTPADASLLLQWTFPDSTPLAKFLLEYRKAEDEYDEIRTLEDEYDEIRTLEGGMRAYTIIDLLPQTYLIRLTPVSTTGEILTDLAVTAEGMPTPSSAFPASADDHFPNPDDVSPGNGLHEGASETPHSGLPPIPFRTVFTLTALALGIYWYRRRKAMLATRAFLTQMHSRYHP
ncbi:hypothetical protein EXS70_02215 [Candidatus Peribacteria bacterium]|nr:hypothetical protein [Candidatus Peribacteria bacterium]